MILINQEVFTLYKEVQTVPEPGINNYSVIKSFCSITINTINKSSVTQFSPNHYLISVILFSSMICRFPDYNDSKISRQQLVPITIS